MLENANRVLRILKEDVKSEVKESLFVEQAEKDLFKAVSEIAKKYDIAENGFRLINNCKEYGGQEVMHMHIHMLAGEKLRTAII